MLNQLLDPQVDSSDFEKSIEALQDAKAFESGGEARGNMYVAADHLQVRGLNAASLVRLLANRVQRHSQRPLIFADVLGGDGLLARAAAQHLTSLPVVVVTSDLSGFMIDRAKSFGLLAIRQPAQQLRFRSEVLDGVILAYGTHHIDRPSRPKALSEAWRVLRPGGGLLLHDFLEGSNAATWFHEVVDKFSATGHLADHFSHREISELFIRAGFEELSIIDQREEIAFNGSSAEESRLKAGQFLYLMYGLVELGVASAGAFFAALELAEHFLEVSTVRLASRFETRVARDVVIASALKPGSELERPSSK